MAAAQTTYAENIGVGIPGAVASAENPGSRITRTAAGNIGFGLPVIRVGDHKAALATQETYEAVGAAGVPAPAGATISAAPVVGAGAKLGVYRIVCILGGATTASRWLVEDPDGNEVGIASGNTEFVGGGLTFTITDSGADPVVGEAFIVTVAASTATDVLDVLGVSLIDRSLVHSTADRYEAGDNMAILAGLTPIFVTYGATVVAGDDVYWNPSTSRYTKTTTHLKMTGWTFEIAGANGDVGIIIKRP